MLPPQSQLSLPMPRNGTLYGAGCPFAARSFASAVGCAVVRYSSHSLASCGVPDPTFTERYAWLPIWSMKSMNSCVPNVFGSITPPQFGFSVAGRAFAGPTPLRQWYSSAKQPPGQLTFATLSALSAATTSLRVPRVLVMGESAPTETASYVPGAM